jgi:hypothetical protein
MALSPRFMQCRSRMAAAGIGRRGAQDSLVELTGAESLLHGVVELRMVFLFLMVT